jgi:hypothetical protein
MLKKWDDSSLESLDDPLTLFAEKPLQDRRRYIRRSRVSTSLLWRERNVSDLTYVVVVFPTIPALFSTNIFPAKQLSEVPFGPRHKIIRAFAGYFLVLLMGSFVFLIKQGPRRRNPVQYEVYTVRGRLT